MRLPLRSILFHDSPRCPKLFTECTLHSRMKVTPGRIIEHQLNTMSRQCSIPTPRRWRWIWNFTGGRSIEQFFGNFCCLGISLEEFPHFTSPIYSVRRWDWRRKGVPIHRQQDKCKKRHEQAAIDAPMHIILFSTNRVNSRLCALGGKHTSGAG